MNRVLLAAALLAAPAPALLAQSARTPAEAQHRQHPRQGQRMERPSPVAMLLQHRAELKLTPQQVSRLEAIERDLAQKNEPIRRQLQAARPQRGERREGPPTEAERQAMRARREQLRPQMEQLRSNNQAAREQVQAVLTAEQKEAARALVREHRHERSHRAGRGERAWRGERGQQAPRSR